MMADFARAVVGSYLMPRRTLRDLLSRDLGVREIALLVLLGYLIEQAIVILIPGARPEGQGFDPAYYVNGMIVSAVSFVIFGWLVYRLGRAFGGHGTLIQSGVMLAWYSVIANLLMPPVLYGLVKIQALRIDGAQMTEEMAKQVQGPFALILSIAGVWLWLLASYVTELHGFKSVMSVVAVIFGVIMAGAVLMTIVVGGMAGA